MSRNLKSVTFSAPDIAASLKSHALIRQQVSVSVPVQVRSIGELSVREAGRFVAVDVVVHT